MTSPEQSRRLGNQLGNDLGQMRVAFDARSYVVEPSYRDDHAGLWERPPAPASAIAPTRQPSEQADTPRPSSEPSHCYPEWDYVIACERPAFCELRDEPAATSAAAVAAPAASLVLRARRRLRRALRARDEWRRASDGSALELAALVDAAAERAATRSSPLRVYGRPAPRWHGSSTLLLLDLSESSNVALANGQRAFELERACASLLTLVALPRLELAIDGFSSVGRKEVRYTRFKDFTEPAHVSAQRLGELRAGGSTRLGAALRHASFRLQSRATPVKLLLVVTDADPADVDVYDPNYLIEDARAAVESARRRGVTVVGCCLPGGSALAQQRIFGSGRAPLARLADLLTCLKVTRTRPGRGRASNRNSASFTQSEGASWKR